MYDERFERLISEAREWNMSGWDFSHFKGRFIESSPSWDFRQMVMKEIRSSNSMVDLGTGGGEFLSSIEPLPQATYVTEGYLPNVKIARDNLHRFGVEVIYTFCEDKNVYPQRGALPFRSDSLDLVIDRHESFMASEVYRVLKKNHRFLTQQVGTGNLSELNELLGAEKRQPVWDLCKCKKQIESAGFEVIESKECKLASYFKDVGAVVCFLKSAPWQIEGFTIEGYIPELRKLHEKIEREGGLKVTSTRFYVLARKN